MNKPVPSATRTVAVRCMVFMLVCVGASAAARAASIAGMPIPRTPSTLADCSGVPGAVVHDDGTYEIAYGGYWEDVSSMRFVDRFTPTFYPATYSSVCVSISKQEVGGTLDGFDFSIIAYADDGPDGTPGTPLGTLPVHVATLPDYVFGAQGEFITVDVTPLALDIAAGSVYLGAEWDATLYPGIFIWMDTDSSGGPPAGGYQNLNEHSWDSLFFTFPDYTALLIRAIERSPAPLLAVDAGEVTIADHCATDPSHSNRVVEPGETVDIDVPVFASTGDFTHVHAALLPPAPAGVTYIDFDSALGDLADGASATANFRIRIDPGFSCLSTFALPISIASDQGSFSGAIDVDVGERAVDVVPHGLPLKTEIAGTTSVIHVPQSAVLSDLDVHVNIRHYSIGSLGFTLTSPAGTTIALLDRPGYPPFPGCENADIDVTFADGEPDPENICANPAGGTPWPVSTAGPTEPLSTFVGENMQGDWTLTVYDYWSDSIGAIIDWSLLPTPAIEDTCAVCADADRIFADGFEPQ
jgi:hypothetical protein